MLRVKEFCLDCGVETHVNKWLAEHKNIKVIDIKYSADQHSSNALIIYESEKKEEGLKRAIELINEEVEFAKQVNSVMAMGMIEIRSKLQTELMEGEE